MAEGTINDPIIKVTEALKESIDKNTTTIGALVQSSIAQHNRYKQDRVQDQQQHEKEKQLENKMQGQEVQVGRDGQLLQEKTMKETRNLGKLGDKGPKDGNMANDKGQQKTNTLLGDLENSTKALSNYMPFGFQENIEAITGKISQSIDKQAGLENLFGAVKGDFSLMLGGLNALQNIPGFNILKVLLMTLVKYVWKGIKWILNVLTNSKELTEDQVRLAKLDQKRLKKLGKDSKLAGKEFKMEGLQLKTKKEGEGWRFASQKGLSRKERGLIKRSTKRADIQKFGKRGAMQEKMMRTFNSLWQSLKPVLKSLKTFLFANKVKTLLILGVIGGIAFALYKLWDNFKVLKDSLMQWLGWQPKNAADAAGIKGETTSGETLKHGSTGEDLQNIQTKENWYGGDEGAAAFFNKDLAGFSEIDRSKIGDVSSKQLLMLLREEGDDLRDRDKIFIQEEIKSRLREKKTNTGQTMTEDYYQDVNQERKDFIEAELERTKQRDLQLGRQLYGHEWYSGMNDEQLAKISKSAQQKYLQQEMSHRNTTNFQPIDPKLSGVVESVWQGF